MRADNSRPTILQCQLHCVLMCYRSTHIANASAHITGCMAFDSSRSSVWIAQTVSYPNVD